MNLTVRPPRGPGSIPSHGGVFQGSTRTHSCGEETLLSSGWTLIGSELLSPNSSVRAERSFAIRYLNVAIKPLCGNLDICLNYYFRHGILFACFRLRFTTESERCFFGSRFSVALLHNLADFATEMHYNREKPEHANAPNIGIQNNIESSHINIYATFIFQTHPTQDPHPWPTLEAHCLQHLHGSHTCSTQSSFGHCTLSW